MLIPESQNVKVQSGPTVNLRSPHQRLMALAISIDQLISEVVLADQAEIACLVSSNEAYHESYARIKLLLSGRLQGTVTSTTSQLVLPVTSAT